MKYKKSTKKEWRFSSPKVELRRAQPMRTTEAAPRQAHDTGRPD